MIRVLHVPQDSLFFDIVYPFWEDNSLFENKAVYISESKDYTFDKIKNKERIEILWGKREIESRFRTDDYDVVFFYSLPVRLYNIIPLIPKEKIIIWWGWGYELYGSYRCLPPLIKINLFKPLTKKYERGRGLTYRNLLSTIKWTLLRKYALKIQRRALERIDYFQPVVKKEFQLMCLNESFGAREFYYKDSSLQYEKTELKKTDGSILLGNSATLTNNHLDVYNYLKEFKQKGQKIYMPLSYGNDEYKKWLLDNIDESDTIPILDFMPSEDYYKILDSCSYAVFGTIRQQALGNINYAISKGIKVFLYKDSVVYKNNIELGFVVYAIEDMDKASLSTPLSLEEIEQNIKALERERNRRMRIYQSCVKEIEDRIRRNNNN